MAENEPAERIIRLSTGILHGTMRLTVEDRGCGLPETDDARIFQPFFTTKEYGIGIGLSICRSIMTAHHGRLWAEPNTGRGTTFHIQLKIIQSPLVNDQKCCIVYLLDDEPRMVKALTRLLSTEGFTVEGFTCPSAFLQAFQPDQRSCLVLDVAMPEVDGLEFQKRLKHMGVIVPIIFLTGHGDAAMSVLARNAGAVDFLTKPVNARDLLSAVKTALDQNRGNQQAGSPGPAAA